MISPHHFPKVRPDSFITHFPAIISQSRESHSPLLSIQTMATREIKTHRVLPEGARAPPRPKWNPQAVHSTPTTAPEQPPAQKTQDSFKNSSSHRWRKQLQYELEDMEKGHANADHDPTKAGDDQQSTGTAKTTDAPVETKVLNVREHCPAETLEESIDLLIRTNKVVVFEKSWCLFSIDSKEFLHSQLQVSFTSVPVDEADDGAAIAEYIKEETGHKTFPAIFVQGDFLGGFEDVNALYSTGELEEEYFKGVTQADRCEMEARAIKSGKKPFFCYPEKVNAYSVRVTGVLTCFASLVSCIGFRFFWGPLIAASILLDFTLRILAGPRLSPISKIGCFLTKPFEPKLRLGRPKQFAACWYATKRKHWVDVPLPLTHLFHCFWFFSGFLFALLSTLAFCLPFPLHEFIGAAFIFGLALATGMEGFLDFCLGCVFFKVGMQLGVIAR